MKIHRILVQAIINNIEQIFVHGKYADKVIEQTFKQNPKWGSRDRAFIAENTYEIVRWWRLINFVGNNSEYNINKGSIWHLFGVWQILKQTPCPEWTEFKHVNPSQITKLTTEAQKDFSIQQSIPTWLHQIGQQQLGDHWQNEVIALNKPAPLIIRANTLKITRQNLVNLLISQDVQAQSLPDSETAILIAKRVNLFSLPQFKQGLFEVQDASSQKVADYLQLKPGMHVVDACAGAGGKTLHISALLQNKGKVTALDVTEWKLNELKNRAKRAGAQNIQTKVIEPHTIEKLYNTSDRLLLDVPCSGLGVIKRNPDAKWKLKPEFIENIQHTQQQILSHYSNIVKPGGLVVYATCSILPSENEKQVEIFLNQNTNFKLINQQSVSPHQTGYDGFHMSLLEREN